MLKEIELRNFLDTVQAMRRAQRAHFAKRDGDILVEAKRLEAAVDVALGSMVEKLKELNWPE